MQYLLHLKEICECTEPLRGSFQSQTTGLCRKIKSVFTLWSIEGASMGKEKYGHLASSKCNLPVQLNNGAVRTENLKTSSKEYHISRKYLFQTVSQQLGYCGCSQLYGRKSRWKEETEVIFLNVKKTKLPLEKWCQMVKMGTLLHGLKVVKSF